MENNYIPPYESKLVRRLFDGQFAITVEITPTVSGCADDVLARAEPLKNLADAINVSGGANANVHLSSIASSSILKANDIEPVTQFTCRNRNQIALLNDLLGASALGIHNLLIRNGDDPTTGDRPEAKPVFDFNSIELIEVAYQMTTRGIIPSKSVKVTDQGITTNTKSLTIPTNFFIGATDTPRAEASKERLRGIKRKKRAGARFIQTQLCYDMSVIRSYAKLLIEEGLSENMFFLLGNGPLLSVKSAKWMRDNLYGVMIPDKILERLQTAPDQKAEGVKICKEQIEEISEIEGLSGVHLIAPTNTESIPEILYETHMQNRQ